MKFSEWEKSVERGTSGDMVWDILSDWKAQIKLTREGLLQSLKDILPLGEKEYFNLHAATPYKLQSPEMDAYLHGLDNGLEASHKDYERQLRKVIG